MNPDGGGGGNGPGNAKISQMIPLLDIVKLFEKISGAASNDARKRYLEKFINHYRTKFKECHKTLSSDKAEGDSLYPFIRLLIPDQDRGRQAFNLGGTALARILVQVFALDPKSKDAQSLLNYKDPAKAGSTAGDLAATTFRIFETRFTSKDIDPNEQMTLLELHQILDHLSESNQEGQKKLMQNCIKRFTALEVMWFVRLLLKDMRLGFSSTKSTVYSLLHKNAKEVAEKIGGDLELLCQRLNDPDVNAADINDISLMHYFRPMLATRMDSIDSNFEGKSSYLTSKAGPSKQGKSSSASVSLPPPPFYVETKWDGERFQIHYDGKSFKYLSRRAYDFSGKFNETLSPRLKPQIKSEAKSFILDGEMMAYNKKYKMFTQKGYNIDVKTMNATNENHCPVFVAFDLVFWNGNSLLQTPLKKRRKLLENVFVEQEDIIRISQIKTMHSKAEVVECLNSAIDDGEEGLIVKDMNSTYEPGQRGSTWLKIKPEFLEDTCVDDLDLVILGAYYTNSKRKGGELTHFLVGLVDISKGKELYYPVAKVGSGRLRSTSVKDLVDELAPKLQNTSPGNIKHQGRKKPDFMIDPTKSVVVQVKASEIIPTDVYALNYTLRFPRIVKIRKDKSPREVMTLDEFTRLRLASGGKLAKRTDRKLSKSEHPFSKRKREQISKKNEDSDTDPEDGDGPQQQRKKTKTPDWKQSNAAESEMDFQIGGGASSKLISVKPLLKSPSSSKSKPVAISHSNQPSLKVNATAPMLLKSPRKTLIKNIFESKIFCVMGGSSWKTEIENRIRHYGGDISQSPDISDLYAIVGERKASVLVQKAIRSQKYNVLPLEYINECIKTGAMIPPHRNIYWGMSEKTRQEFELEFDEFGDSYRTENTFEETCQLVKKLIEEEEIEEKYQSPTKMSLQGRSKKESETSASDSDTDFEDNHDSGRNSSSSPEFLKEMFPGTPESESRSFNYNFMKNIEVAFRGKPDEVLRSKLEFYGGKIAESEESSGITHVVLCNVGCTTRDDNPRAILVTEKWLEDCFAKKDALDERHYLSSR